MVTSRHDHAAVDVAASRSSFSANSQVLVPPDFRLWLAGLPCDVASRLANEVGHGLVDAAVAGGHQFRKVQSTGQRSMVGRIRLEPLDPNNWLASHVPGEVLAKGLAFQAEGCDLNVKAPSGQLD